jgi:hypothetical protein
VAEKGRVFTGARARFLLNGKKVGYARNVSGREEINYEDVNVLDNIQPEEQVATGYTCSMTSSLFRIVGESLKSQGWFPSIGANPEEHLKNILTNGDLVATIEDNQTGKIMATYEQVKVRGHNWTIDARGVVGEDVDFVAIRAKDESEI